MTTEELAVKLEAVEQRSRSNTRRIETLEKTADALNQLITSVQVIAAKADGKVEALEGKPGRRWESLVEKILLVLAGAFAAWLAAGAPGG